ncbi:MAG TPA: protein kinase [Gemmatimonadales bacterium]|nr:protein kinase [Gemmatimonadales bacterium]
MTSIATCPRCGEAVGPADRFCARCGSDVSGVHGDVATEVVRGPAIKTVDQQRALLETLRQATLGDYEVRAEVGRGGMATVFLAHDVALDRKVAIKVMAPALLSDPGFAERFKREARTAASLSHPNIIPIYAVKEGEHLLYFVMKFIEGRPLDSIIKEVGPLPIPMVQAILHQVGGALGYAHKRRVVHRDVKPANIMVDSDGWAIVTDFGIAKGSESHGLTVTGATVGTPSYMSPEQCGAKELTGASDQYSLGVVAYEMLAGRLPFAADSVMAIMYAHFNEVPAPVTNVRPDVPPGLAGAVMRMLEKEPGKRWPSLEAALAAVGGAPLAHDDPIRTHLVTLAAAGAASQLAKRISTPVSPMPAVKSGAGKTSNIAALSIAPRRTTIAVGGAVQLSATTRRISGTTQPGHGITWASTNTEVVTVSSSGLATAIGPGTATVTATQENTSATATITVTAAEQERRRVWPAVAAGVVLVGAAGAAWWLKPWQGTGSGTLPAEPSPPSVRAESTVLAPPTPPAPPPAVVDSTPTRQTPKRTAQPGKRQGAVPPHRDTVSPQQAAPLLPPAPAPAPAPPPAPPPVASSTATVPPAPPPPPDPRPQIEAAIASYARALQARDINAVKRIAPGLGPQALSNLQDFFQRVTGLKANLQVSRVDVNGDQGGADVSGTLEYVNNGTRVTQPLNFHATLERRAEGWRIMQLQ